MSSVTEDGRAPLFKLFRQPKLREEQPVRTDWRAWANPCLLWLGKGSRSLDVLQTKQRRETKHSLIRPARKLG
jgi:hypothetical protein